MAKRITDYELDGQTGRRLDQLYREWDGCTRCPLGERRCQIDTKMVPGEGRTRAIMLVDEGPGETEESLGQAFTSSSGYLLREVLEALGAADLVYLTYVTSCRPCQHKIDKNGQPVFRRRGMAAPVPVWEDIPPPKASVDACWPRLHQEIYSVDPVVIVTMGNPAAEALLGHSIHITKSRGRPETMAIDGVGYEASFTEKKNAWIRGYTKKGGFVMPTKRVEVTYTVIPTLRPSFVLSHASDGAKDSPFQQFTADIRLAVSIYERYMLETFGTMPTNSTAEVQHDSQDD